MARSTERNQRMPSTPWQCAILACLLLAGCKEEIFWEPSNAEKAACMKSRPNDAEAQKNCYWMLVYERRSK